LGLNPLENRRIGNSITYTAKQEGKIEIAKKAITKGFDNETIAELTGLTVEQIEQLRSEKE
jgi:predicted transposase/invertase (TIGR01784 family)